MTIISMGSGRTRTVFLVGSVAIKCARLRFIRLFLRMIAFPFMSRNNHHRFHRVYGPFPGACWRYLAYGLYANRQEYFYCRDSSDRRVVPTFAMYLGGWITLQRRGSPITANELAKENPFLGLPANPDFLECDQPWQFCRDDEGRVVLLDYGRKETCIALRQTNGISAIRTHP